MGITGPTLPFLIGAPRIVKLDTAEVAAGIERLGALLYSLQHAQPYRIRVAKCGSLNEPTVELLPASGAMDLAELVGDHQSSLYVSSEYPHRRNFQRACEALWESVGRTIEQGYFSFHNRRYVAFTGDDIAFVSGVAAGFQQ